MSDVSSRSTATQVKLGKASDFAIHDALIEIVNLQKPHFHGKILEMNTWEEDECNTYQGTDSTIFASMLTHKEGRSQYLTLVR